MFVFIAGVLFFCGFVSFLGVMLSETYERSMSFTSLVYFFGILSLLNLIIWYSTTVITE